MKPYIYTLILACSMMAGFSASAQTPAVRVSTEPEDTTIYTYVEEMPYYMGTSSLTTFIRENTVYPAIAKDNGFEGTAYVKLTIDKKGTVTDAVISISTDNAEMDAEAIRVCRLINGFTPGKQNGKAVRVYYTVPVAFYLEADNVAGDPDDMMMMEPPPPPYDTDSVIRVTDDYMEMDAPSVSSDYDYSDAIAVPAEEPYSRSYIQKKNIKDLKIEEKPDKKAGYAYGITEMFKVINRDVQYPYSYYGNRPKGYVVLKFVVGADSVLYNAEVSKSMGSEYDQNALNLLNNMRLDWLPATKKGKPVASYFYMPVRFEYKKSSWEYSDY